MGTTMPAKRKTLCQFLFSRTGFGRTSWPAFAAITTMVGLMAWYALFSGSEEMAARVVSGFFAVFITAIMAWGTWRNYKGKQG